MAKSLTYYLAELRRLEYRRTREVEQELRDMYREVLGDLESFLTDYYVAYGEDDRLTQDTLRGKGELARFLEEVRAQGGSIGQRESALIDRVVGEVYGLAYSGTVEAVSRAVTKEAVRSSLSPLRKTQADAIRHMVKNPVSKLTLPETLAGHRADIVKGIKQSIVNGLANGDRYTSMAKRVRESLNGDYVKAMRTVRTETHRIRESAHHEAMGDIDLKLEEGGRASGLVMVKTWRTMQDELVRPQRGLSKKTGKKLASGGRADHVKMNGVTIPVSEKFDLGNGVFADAPGNSGDAGNDINCRCILLYDMQDMDGNSVVGNKTGYPNGGPGDILKEPQKDEAGQYQIDDGSISKVPLPQSQLLTPAQNERLQQESKSLLDLMRNEAIGTEGARTFDMSMRKLSQRIGEPGAGRVNIPYENVPYLSIHNHPSGLIFSPADVGNFVMNENMQIMAVVGNNGAGYLLEKLPEFRAAGFMRFYNNLEAEMPDDVLGFMKKLMKGAGGYGFHFDG